MPEFRMSFQAGPAPLGGRPGPGGPCRAGHPGCPVPWGYDEAHTDQPTPYTVEQLAVREGCPHRYAYPDAESYLQGWKLWSLLRADGRLSPAERDVVDVIRMDRIAAQMAAVRGVPVGEITACS